MANDKIVRKRGYERYEKKSGKHVLSVLDFFDRLHGGMDIRRDFLLDYGRNA